MAALCVAFFLLLVLAETVPARDSPRRNAALRERVILIHGLGRTPLSMIPLKWRLEQAGYDVVNLRYPSRQAEALQTASENLDKAINLQNQTIPDRIHFVTHSFGGIVVRNYMGSHVVNNLGRVVMLAPPNHGSELADHLRKYALGRWILGPVGRQMGTTATDLPARLGPAYFPLGIIAADGPGIPWDYCVRQGPSDGIVSVQSAKLDGMDDFIVVHASHTLMMWRKNTSREVLAFLKKGHFEPNGK